ncbi:MAG: Amylo-alpha6-glucosidase [Parcubacteria group bacterium]|nr:Amylo-alpha6-glucosidase [Parcubacteria group bacterium]
MKSTTLVYIDMNDALRTLGRATIEELETARGILASGKEEIYGCIFGRDSLITALKLLSAHERTPDPYLLALVKKILMSLVELQGTTVNIESGEEPGKIIHEYREDNHAHLTQHHARPWYVYPDGTMRIYDSVDSTPLFLIAVARYWTLSADEDFKERIAPNIEAALSWVRGSIKADARGFLTYRVHPERTHGGLATQSWMDSSESVFHEDGSPTPYPIAPVEAQAYAYLALKLWSIESEAVELKERFNRHFVTEAPEFGIAFALDGDGARLTSLRSSVGHILWAAHETDSILEKKHIPKLVNLLMSPELFEPNAGIRTLSKRSSKYDPNSYHNGSIWPHDTAIVAEGLRRFGYTLEAQALGEALHHSWDHFKTPIELFVYTTEEGFAEYVSETGQRACMKQAWSAASMLAEL